MRRAGWLLTACLVLPRALGAEEFHLKDGDRVVFYGDSITQDGGYARGVEVFTATRFPARDVTFWYAGVGGDRVSGGWAGPIDLRLDRDVIAHRPTVVTVMLGMNDGGYRAFDPALFEAYSAGYRHLVARLKQALPGIRLTLIQPSPFDDVTRAPGGPEGYNAVLRRYADFVAGLAHETGSATADLNGPVVAGLQKVQKIDPALARQLVPDRVHPGTAGHLVMAAALLRAWNAPATVTRVHVEAGGPRVVASQGAALSELTRAGDSLAWTQADDALPLPMDFANAEVELAEMAGADLAGLDEEVLRVTGLAGGRYRLAIDGKPAGEFSDGELAAGVSLARLDTPMRQQAAPVGWGVQDRQEVLTVRRRLMVMGAADAGLAETARTLGTVADGMARERRQPTRPTPHRYELAKR
jgi:lysophospholipase L1-like esterase